MYEMLKTNQYLFKLTFFYLQMKSLILSSKKEKSQPQSIISSLSVKRSLDQSENIRNPLVQSFIF